MSRSIPDHALVVVADGGKAKMFRATHAGDALHLREEGHAHSAGHVDETPSGSRPGDQSPRQTEEAGFVNRLAHTLHDLHSHGKYKDLVLVVGPQTLGQLRSALHKNVENAVVRTVNKDLTNHSTQDIAHALAD